MKWMLLGNGLWEQSCYNTRLQPERIRVGSATITDCASSSDLLNLYNTYGATSNDYGNVLSQTIGRPAGCVTHIFGYDGVNRLTSVSQTRGWSSIHR